MKKHQLCCIGPVSYTHLDVYKRQVSELVSGLRLIRYSGTCRTPYQRRFETCATVSYTHLDVYKRQGNGFAYNETNILSIVDRSILGDAHMYQDNHIDPEGLLSTCLLYTSRCV